MRAHHSPWDAPWDAQARGGALLLSWQVSCSADILVGFGMILVEQVSQC